MKAIVMNKTDIGFDRIRHVAACRGRDRMQPALQRVWVEEVKGGITVTACDGVRLRRDFFVLRTKPGLYDVKANSTKQIVLEYCEILLRYPEYRKLIPATDRNAYAVSGKGAGFVLWAASVLGACVDPKLMAIGDDEMMDVFVQKSDPGNSPVLLKNKTSLLVIMPVRIDAAVTEKLIGLQFDRLCRQRNPQPKPKADAAQL